MSRYFYAMTQRPAMPGAMPHDGLREVLPGDQQTAEALGHQVYNVLVYDRPLAAKEVYDYELQILPAQAHAGSHRVIA